MTIIALGEITVWLFLPSIFDRFGSLSIVSMSLGMFYFSFFAVLGIFLFRYAIGKPIRHFGFLLVQAYVGLAILIALGFAYAALLPNVLFVWPFCILPLGTMIGVFYLLRMIPRFRKRIDTLSQDWR